MTKFTFISEDEDGVRATVECETDIWLDVFPHFLNLMRASGFNIADGTALYVPNTSKQFFNDRDFLLFDSDIKTEDETLTEKTEWLRQ